MSTQVMLDIETLSTDPRATILSIGAVKFDATGVTDDTFYTTINLADQKSIGRIVSPDTIDWWKNRTREAQQVIRDAKSSDHTLKDALTSFSMWFGRKSLPTWGNGSDFDNVIVQTAYEDVKMVPPWKFWHNRCYRTMKNVFDISEPERVGTHHNALDDAIHQAKCLAELLSHG